MYEKDLPVRYCTVGFIINEDRSKIYLIKRARDPFQDFWSAPSGVGASRRIDNPEEAVVKEIEVDLKVKYNLKGLILSEKTEDNLPIHYYYGTIEGEPEINSRFVSEGKWFDIEDALKLKLAFEQSKALEELIKIL